MCSIFPIGPLQSFLRANYKSTLMLRSTQKTAVPRASGFGASYKSRNPAFPLAPFESFGTIAKRLGLSSIVVRRCRVLRRNCSKSFIGWRVMVVWLEQMRSSASSIIGAERRHHAFDDIDGIFEQVGERDLQPRTSAQRGVEWSDRWCVRTLTRRHCRTARPEYRVSSPCRQGCPGCQSRGRS